MRLSHSACIGWPSIACQQSHAEGANLLGDCIAELRGSPARRPGAWGRVAGALGRRGWKKRRGRPALGRSRPSRPSDRARPRLAANRKDDDSSGQATTHHMLRIPRECALLKSPFLSEGGSHAIVDEERHRGSVDFDFGSILPGSSSVSSSSFRPWYAASARNEESARFGLKHPRFVAREERVTAESNPRRNSCREVRASS